ncbi:MAG: LysM peptidoglycan-binding domain-containing protein [Actinomycetota bacterium]|nr:LysM peptidoglycan-binding domain-containing protein [Actinomycetota bacterium]
MTSIAGARIRALSIISITIVVVLLLLASAGNASSGPAETLSYRVKGGDTLWQIAAEFGPADSDRRQTVAIIEDLNGINAGTLQIGQVIEIPVADS